MLTPKFEVKQDDAYLYITIFAPYARVSDAELSTEGDTLVFFSTPYYLRLTFSGKLVDSELEGHKAEYDADKNAFIMSCKKLTPGEHFNNLDMLTALLAPQGATGVNKPLIEVVDGDGEDEDVAEDEDFDWAYEQTLPDETIVTAGYKYGFGNNHTGVFKVLQNELKGVVDIADPDNKSASARREERLLQEQNDFDEDHYLADYFEVDTAEQCVEFIPEFYSITRDEVQLNDQEKEELLRLPRKEHLLDSGAKSLVYLGLVDILCAWSYNHRVTLGENCVESAWNIWKLSATLSWLDSFTHLKDVVLSFICRSLTYPLVRNWHLSQAVLKDTAHLLYLGRKQVLRCLLEIQRMFNKSEPRYLLNQLYITDYCVWIQTVSDSKLISLADSLRKLKSTKADTGLDLEDLETAALLVLEEEENAINPADNVNNLAADFAGMTVIENGAVIGSNDNEDVVSPAAVINPARDGLSHLSDSNSSSSESDSDDDDDSDSDSSDSSDDSSDDSEKGDSSSESSELDSDDDSSSESEGA